jgi:hypothetical protein
VLISEMGRKQLQLAVFRSPRQPAAQRQRHGDAERPGRLEGKVISERTAKQRLGTSGRCALTRLGIRSHLVPRRSRYFAFGGDRREQDTLRAPTANRRAPARVGRHPGGGGRSPVRIGPEATKPMHREKPKCSGKRRS